MKSDRCLSRRKTSCWRWFLNEEEPSQAQQPSICRDKKVYTPPSLSLPTMQLKTSICATVEIKQYTQTKKILDKPHDLLCPVCMQYLVFPVSTVCAHTFCDRCIEDSLIFKPHHCPVCRSYLRGTELIPCLAISNIVKMQEFLPQFFIVCRHLNTQPEEIRQHYKNRYENMEKFYENKKVSKQDLVKGQRIDVRDTQFIWCKAQILDVWFKGDQVFQVLVHYLGWNKIYDEIIEVTSTRLARLGIYTSRTELPRYAHGQNADNLYSYIVQGPVPPPPAPQQDSDSQSSHDDSQEEENDNQENNNQENEDQQQNSVQDSDAEQQGVAQALAQLQAGELSPNRLSSNGSVAGSIEEEPNNNMDIEEAPVANQAQQVEQQQQPH